MWVAYLYARFSPSEDPPLHLRTSVSQHFDISEGSVLSSRFVNIRASRQPAGSSVREVGVPFSCSLGHTRGAYSGARSMFEGPHSDYVSPPLFTSLSDGVMV